MTESTERETVWDRMASRRASRGRGHGLERSDVVRALACFPVAFLVGLVTFAIGSSRGGNAYELAAIGSLIVVVTGVIAVLVGLGLAWFEGRMTLILSIPVIVAGTAFGGAIAERLVPGDTTDGSMSWIPAIGFVRSEGGSVCRWADGHVVEVRSRRYLGFDDDGMPNSMRFELGPLGTTVLPTLVVDRIDIETGQAKPFVTLAATNLQSADPTGRHGRLSVISGDLTWDCPAQP